MGAGSFDVRWLSEKRKGSPKNGKMHPMRHTVPSKDPTGEVLCTDSSRQRALVASAGDGGRSAWHWQQD